MRIGALLGNRVWLRRASEGDSQVIEAWYEEAANAAYDDVSLRERFRAKALSGLFTLVREDESEPIGLLEYQGSALEASWLTVSFIALGKAYRGWGYGSEAVRLLEEWAVREGVAQRFRAEVDVRNGLGLYFWLRLGYRPAGGGDHDTFVLVRTS